MRKRIYYTLKRIYDFKILDADDFFTKDGFKVKHSEKQIRKRVSYNFWQPIVQQVSQNNYTAKDRNNILKKMWNQMDQRSFFGSHTQANYDLESLALCAKDYDDGHWREK